VIAKHIEPKYPHGLRESLTSMARCLKMYEDGKLPKTIDIFMLETPALRYLRCIYGSDLRVALHLLHHAITGKWMVLSCRLRWKFCKWLGITPREETL
jgi:hypothetical protein